MKLFIDCEFNGYQGALISMALVPEMGEPFYHVLNTDGVKIDPWVRENVMDRLIYNHRGDYPIPEFFMHLSRAMSVASMQRAKCLQPKTKDEASAKMWGEFHHLLTHACAGMHEPQYERMRNGHRKTTER